MKSVSLYGESLSHIFEKTTTLHHVKMKHHVDNYYLILKQETILCQKRETQIVFVC